VGIAALYWPQAFCTRCTSPSAGRGKSLPAPRAGCRRRKLSLKCQAANAGAQAFYVREGFRCTESGEDGGILAQFERGDVTQA
jgi:hypothetical protein